VTSSFHDEFVAAFHAHSARLLRFLDRLADDGELAADLLQETFIRLYQRGSLPDAPEAWLITVALNLFRNARATRVRRHRLLPLTRGVMVAADPPASPEHDLAASEARVRVRRALDRLAQRERALLLLIAEGYTYRQIALALNLNERSVGTLLARAKRSFRAAYQE
jgi:RNA polymerase sigma-70 factor (ECF subfamily)